MKKIATTLVLLWKGSGILFALPLGNPVEPVLYTDSFWSDVGPAEIGAPGFCCATAWNVRIGFYGDYVYNRYLEVTRNEAIHKVVDRTQIFTNSGFFALNLCERADFFLTLGESTLSAEMVLDDHAIADLYFRNDFSWSVGGRIALFEWNCFGLGIEGQYFRTHPRFDHFLLRDTGLFDYVDERSTYREWQIGTGISYYYGLPCSPLAFIPYIGLRWSEAHFDLGDLLSAIGEEITDFRAEKLWGYATGMTFLLGDMISVEVEGRFASEKALYVNGQLRF